MSFKKPQLTRRFALLTVVVLLVIASMSMAARAALSDGSGTDSSSTSSAASGSTGSGDDNVAVASNGRDGSEVYAVRLKVVQTNGPTVDSTNAAVAQASCTDCTTVAVAIEGVLVYGDDVDTVTPVNLAIALNSDCSGCKTLAAAYQYVTQNDTRMRITGQGRQTIASLRQQLNTLRQQDLTPQQVLAEVDRIAMEFYAVLKNEVVPIGKTSGEFPAEDAKPSTDEDESTPSTEPTASPTSPSPNTVEATPTPSPSTATPSPSESTPTSSDSPSPSSSPSDTPTPSPTSSTTETGSTPSAVDTPTPTPTPTG